MNTELMLLKYIIMIIEASQYGYQVYKIIACFICVSDVVDMVDNL